MQAEILIHICDQCGHGSSKQLICSCCWLSKHATMCEREQPAYFTHSDSGLVFLITLCLASIMFTTTLCPHNFSMSPKHGCSSPALPTWKSHLGLDQYAGIPKPIVLQEQTATNTILHYKLILLSSD